MKCVSHGIYTLGVGDSVTVGTEERAGTDVGVVVQVDALDAYRLTVEFHVNPPLDRAVVWWVPDLMAMRQSAFPSGRVRWHAVSDETARPARALCSPADVLAPDPVVPWKLIGSRSWR